MVDNVRYDHEAVVPAEQETASSYLLLMDIAATSIFLGTVCTT
jgi:hypothetical protein